jgi:hypothetical protein
MMKASRLPVLAAAFVLCLSGTACKQNVDLSGVGDLAKSVAASNDALQALPEDFYDSCVRQVTWSRGSLLTLPPAPPSVAPPAPPALPAPPAPAPVPAASPQTDEVTAALKRALGALPASSSVADIFDVQTYCKPNKEASEQMLALTSVLTDYFYALGNLAATGSTTGIGIDKLGAAVNGLDPASAFNRSGKTAAIAGALDGLAAGLIAAKARDDIATEAIAANDLVAKLIGRLTSDTTAGEADNVAALYLEQLRNERFAMHTFYQNNIGATHSGIERLDAFNYYVNEAAEDAKLDKRVAAAQSYRSALAHLGGAHGAIVDAANTNNLASIESIARAYAQQYQPQIDSLRKAFK